MSVRTPNPVIFFALLLAAVPAMAADAPAPAPVPWTLGMSKEQVVALAEQGPYADAASGAVETTSAPFAGRKVKATLVFGAAGLASIEYHIYAGSEWREAEKGVMQVFDHFKAAHGGANVKEVSDNIDRDELNLIVRQTIGTAEAMNKGYAPRGQYMVQTFDMVPVKQPAEGRLHCQWIYDGRSNTYSVFLYQDLPSAPKRDVADNTQIKKL